MNEANVIVESDSCVLDTIEVKLGKQVSAIEVKAQSLLVNSDDSFELAAEITREVKRMQNAVTEYWEPLRVTTYDAYKKVIAQKKEMLDPLSSAEKILKRKMSDFSLEKERKRKAMEDAMKRQAEAEVEKKIEEAAIAESNGDVEQCEYALAEAEVMEATAYSGSVAAEAPKPKGVSSSRTWKITNVDSEKVPISFSGVELRPVDEKLVMQLIKASKGKIVIPGITYEEDVTISVRV